MSDISYICNLFVFGQTSLLIKMKVIRPLFRMHVAKKRLLLNFEGMKLLTIIIILEYLLEFTHKKYQAATTATASTM